MHTWFLFSQYIDLHYVSGPSLKYKMKHLFKNYDLKKKNQVFYRPHKHLPQTLSCQCLVTEATCSQCLGLKADSRAVCVAGWLSEGLWLLGLHDRSSACALLRDLRGWKRARWLGVSEPDVQMFPFVSGPPLSPLQIRTTIWSLDIVRNVALWMESWFRVEKDDMTKWKQQIEGLVVKPLFIHHLFKSLWQRWTSKRWFCEA